MNITCPQCQFSRTMDENNLPPRATMATCPHCSHRFRFREIPENQNPLTPSEHQRPEDSTSVQRKTDDDFWQALEDMAHQKENTPANEAERTTEQPSEEDTTSTLNKEIKTKFPVEDVTQNSEEYQLRTPAWETAQRDYIKAFLQTFADLLLTPQAFFRGMPVGISMVRPLIFYAIILQIVAVSAALWQFLGIHAPVAMTEQLGPVVRAFSALIIFPLEACFALLIDASITHACLRLHKADRKGFAGTFRAVLYSSAPVLLYIVPYLGLPLTVLVTLIYKFLGLKYVHGATSGQIASVLALQILLGCIAALIILGLGGSASPI